MFWKKILHNLSPFFGLLLFVVALLVLRHELRSYHLQEIMNQLRSLPHSRLLVALALTILSYLVMTGYDFLAFLYIHRPFEYGKITVAAFTAYAFSNNVGMAMLSGGSIRYRLYSAWGVSSQDITKVVLFCSMTFWLGFLVLGGVLFSFEPMAIPRALHIPFDSARPVGVAFLSVFLAYLVWSLLLRKTIKFQGWEIAIPSGRLLLAQVAVSVLDWALAASVLYALLPSMPNGKFLAFFGVFMLAQTAGLISQIPGGLGVFETVVILLLSPVLPASKILGALLAFRGIYYLLPLCTAAVLLGIQEVLQQKEKFQRLAEGFGQWASLMVPQVLAFATFVGGAILLFSGATPSLPWRLAWIKNLFPQPFIELSHFLGSIAGVLLLLLARGLQRRLDAAYVLTVALLGAGIVFSLVKGLDYEESSVLIALLMALIPCRRYFYRKASLINQPFTSGWAAAVVIVLLSSLWLAIFSHKHAEYSQDLWWAFSFSGHAPLFLRSTVAALAVALIFAISRLFRPNPPKPQPPNLTELDKVLVIIERSRSTYGNLALLGDKSLLYSPKEDAFLMYGTEGRSWVSMGDPVGALEEWPELIWQFRDLCDRYDGWTVFYEVGSAQLAIYLDLGLTLFKLGEEARVSLETFSLEGGARKGLRYTQRKLEKEGCSFVVLPREQMPQFLGELKSVSNAWLADKHTREKRFSLGFFDERYLSHFPLALVYKDGRVIAFANIWGGSGKEELSIDLMRYLPESPHGVMEYLFIELMLWGKQKGYGWFNLGMAPLAGLEDQTQAPLWSKLGAFIFRHGEHFYNFQGLRNYKEKFDPVWEPKYLAAPAGLALPRILTNISSLISGGIGGVLSK
jgi:phosphatidylglycerol lysyltransferase